MGGNSEVILSHTTIQLHFYKQLLQNFTLDRNIMVYNTIESGCGLINAVALLGGDTTSVHIKTITTDHDNTNTEENCMCRICTTNAESLVIEMQILGMNNVKLCPKTKTSNVSE